MSSKPSVIVLMLNYNGKDLLKEAIESYANNKYENFEVVIIDNNSKDGSVEYVKSNYPNVTLLALDKNHGYAKGFNFGLKYAFEEKKADFALVSNNDVKADPNIIEHLVTAANSKPDIGFTIGKVYFYESPNTLQSVGKHHTEKFWSSGHISNIVEDVGQFNEACYREWCDDIYWLVNKKVYDATGGGYDEEFTFQAEDFDWQVRAKKLGYKIFYTPEAKLWHKDSITIGKRSPFKAYFDFRNPLIVHMKHRKFSDYQYFYKARRRYLLITIARSILRLNFKYALKSIQGFTSALRWGLRNKKIKFYQIFSL